MPNKPQTEVFDVEQELEQISYLKNQIATLELMLTAKKRKFGTYFDRSGENSVSNNNLTVYVQTKTAIDYDIPKLEEKLDSDLLNEFITKTYSISDWKGLRKYLKANGISIKELKPYISVEKQVNKEKLSKIYESGEITLEDLEGCYNAKVTKTVALRMKENEQKGASEK